MVRFTYKFFLSEGEELFLRGRVAARPLSLLVGSFQETFRSPFLLARLSSGGLPLLLLNLLLLS
jgi:hypothetical protein